MSNGPVDARRQGSFGDEMEAEPTAAAVNSFQLALFKDGVHLGWLGKNGSDWAILVTNPGDAVTLEAYPYNGVTYYRIQGTNRYLSVNRNAYAGFYLWSGATGFRRVKEDRHTYLISDYNRQKLSLYSPDDGYLYFWDEYSVLDVKVESKAKPEVVDPPLTGQIEHVVVLMLENRSFDNMLGGLYPELTREGLYRGLRGDEKIPLDPSEPGKGSASVFQETNPEEAMIMPYPDPGELFADMNEQIFGGGKEPTMSGFACNYGKQKGAPRTPGGSPERPQPRNIMQYYAPEMLPMTTFLARQYAVCDAWFAAGPVQTLANRVFAHCGTPGRVDGTNRSRVNNPDFLHGWKIEPPTTPPIHEKTIFELLDDAYPGEANWKVYYHDTPLSALCSYVYQHWTWLSWDDGNVFRFKERLGSQTNLEYDIKNNRLPKYSFIEPRYTNTFGERPNSNHPGGAGIDIEDPNGNSLPPPISVADGEALLHEIYTIFTKYPETFAKTLLIVTYDEHGGLYDHVPPPKATSPFQEPVTNFNYDRYGVRVPAVLINPHIKPGTIYPPRKGGELPAFDHTSLISTLIAQFGLGATSSLTPRVASAPQLRDLISEGPPAPRPAPPKVDVKPSVPVDAARAGATGNPNSLAEALGPLLNIEKNAPSVRRG